MRKTALEIGEHYHIYNRGNNKQTIFTGKDDRARFLFLLLYLQSPHYFTNIKRIVKSFSEQRGFLVDEKDLRNIYSRLYIALECFALMDNHFHLLVYQKSSDGISQYMQRVLNAYTKYYNTKYKKSGHLFEGPFKVVHIQTNAQLLHLSAYIHRNPRELKAWKEKELIYPWSSYQDYCGANRWGALLNTKTILRQLTNSEYKHFVETSATKMLPEESMFD